MDCASGTPLHVCVLQVFTTCSSEVKRNFLLETFPELKAQNIGDSRSCAFEETVMTGTNGRGVDLCLNSLDQDKLQVREEGFQHPPPGVSA